MCVFDNFWVRFWWALDLRRTRRSGFEFRFLVFCVVLVSSFSHLVAHLCRGSGSLAKEVRALRSNCSILCSPFDSSEHPLQR